MEMCRKCDQRTRVMVHRRTRKMIYERGRQWQKHFVIKSREALTVCVLDILRMLLNRMLEKN